MNLIKLNLNSCQMSFGPCMNAQIILKQQQCLTAYHSILCRNDCEMMKRIAQLGYSRVSNASQSTHT